MGTLGPQTTPGTYEFDTLDLLHDPGPNRWTLAQIDNYINKARRQCVKDTFCLRSLQQTFLTQGVEQYVFGTVAGASIVSGGIGYSSPTVAFTGGGGTGVAATLSQSGGAVNTITFTSFGSGYTSAPTAVISDPSGTGAQITVGIVNANTHDIINVQPLWGTDRYSMGWMPFSSFSAWMRPFLASQYQSTPRKWAVYGEQSFYVGPTPDQTYPVELDSIVLPTPFVVGDYTTVDPIPVKYQDSISYYAAYLAKNNVEAFGEAQGFLNEYRRLIAETGASFVGRVPNPYGSV